MEAAITPPEGNVAVLTRLVKIDRSSPVPLYYQVSKQLEEAIESGAIAKGDRIGAETELAESWGISRPTVRQAIQELVNKGLLVRRRGVGTEVINTQVTRPVRLTSLYDDLQEAGHEPRTTVLRYERVPADANVAEQLHVAEGTEVIYLERLRFAEDSPLALMHNWLPVEVAGGFTNEQLEASGLYELLRENGVHPSTAAQRIGAKAADDNEARLLEVNGGAPLVTMQRLTRDTHERLVEFASHVYRAEMYYVDVTIAAD